MHEDQTLEVNYELAVIAVPLLEEALERDMGGRSVKNGRCNGAKATVANVKTEVPA